MSLTNEAETNLLKLMFQNIAWAFIGDASGLQPSGAPGSYYISLHTADPTETGDQTSGEANYQGYARQLVVRSAGGFTVSGDTVSNAGAVTFPKCTLGSNTASYFGIGTSINGPGHLVAVGDILTPLAISANITPSFAIGALQATAQ
jgi:hypothetical protein